MINPQFVANAMARMARASLLASVAFSVSVYAQVKPGTIIGVVTDPAGAVAPNARISLSGPGGLAKETNPDEQGRFALTGLPPGEFGTSMATSGRSSANRTVEFQMRFSF